MSGTTTASAGTVILGVRPDGTGFGTSLADIIKAEAGGVGGMLGQLVMGGLKEFAAPIAAIIAGFSVAHVIEESMQSFENLASSVRNMQRLIGGSAEDVSGLIGAMQLAGVNADNTTAAFRIFSKHLQDASGDAAKTAEMTQKLGGSFLDASGNIRPMNEILPQLADQFKAMPNGAEKTALAVELFGRSGTVMIPILNKGAEGIAELTGKAKELGITLTDENLAAYMESQKAAREFNAAIQGLQVQIGAALLPAIEGVVDFFRSKLIPILESATNWVKQHHEVFDALGKNIQSVVKPIWEAFANIMTSLVIPAFLAVAQGISNVIGFIKDNTTWLTPLAIAFGVVTGYIVAYNTVMNISRGIQIGFAAASYGAEAATYAVGLAQKAGALAYTLMNSSIVSNTAALLANESLSIGTKLAIIASTVATSAATAATWLFNAAMTALGGPIGLIVVAIAAVVAGLIWFFTQTDLGRAIWQGFVEALGTAWNWLWTNVLQPTFKAIGDIFTWLFTYIIMPIVQGIVLYVVIWADIYTWLWNTIIWPVLQAIGQAMVWLYQTVIQPVVDLISGAIQVAGAVFKWLYDNAIKPAFDNISTAFNWIWQNVIKPTFDWISGAIKTVGSTVSSIFGGIATTVQNAFQAVVGVIRGPVNAIIGFLNSAIRGINSIHIDIPEWARGFFGGASTFSLHLSQIPELAQGGVVMPKPGGQIVRVAEAGEPEAIVPLSKMNQVSGGKGSTVNYYAAPNQSLSNEDALFQAMRRSKLLAGW